MKWLLVLVACVAYTQAAPVEDVPTEHLPGIVLVPGFGGSKLYGEPDHILKCIPYEKKIWAVARLLSKVWLAPRPPFIDTNHCPEDLEKLMTLHYNSTSGTTYQRGTIRTDALGDPRPLFDIMSSMFNQVNYMDQLVYRLYKMGYNTTNDRIKGAPFDWRKSPSELVDYFKELTTMIEELSATTGGPSILVAHSMGAPLMNIFLNTKTQEWRTNNVRSLVSLAGAWGGSMKALKQYFAGETFNGFVDGDMIRRMAMSFPGTTFMLPAPGLWGPEETIVKDEERTYTVNDMAQVMRKFATPEAGIYYEDTRKFNKSGTAPNVELHCLYGTGQRTTSKILADSADLEHTIEESDDFGDGTVNLRSLELCKNYAALQLQPVHSRAFAHVDHLSILVNDEVADYITKVIIKEVNDRSQRKNRSYRKIDGQRILERIHDTIIPEELVAMERLHEQNRQVEMLRRLKIST